MQNNVLFNQIVQTSGIRMMSIAIESDAVVKASLTPKDVKHLFDTGICPFCCIRTVGDLPSCEVAVYAEMSDADTVLIQGANTSIEGNITDNIWTIE